MKKLGWKKLVEEGDERQRKGRLSLCVLLCKYTGINVRVIVHVCGHECVRVIMYVHVRIHVHT